MQSVEVQLPKADFERASALARQRNVTLNELLLDAIREYPQPESEFLQARPSQPDKQCVITIDMDGRIVDTNEDARTLLNSPLHELISRPFLDFIRQRERSKLRQFLTTAIKNPEDTLEPVPLTILQGDRTCRAAILSYLGKGKRPEMLMLRLVDISAVAEVNDVQSIPQDLYQRLLDTVPMCVFRKDTKHRFTFANGPFLRELETTPSALISNTDEDFSRWRFAEKYHADEDWVMNKGRALETVELHRPPTGEARAVQVIKLPLRENGKVQGVQVMFWDVAHRVAALAALSKIRNVLELGIVQRLSEVEQLNASLVSELDAIKRAERRLRRSTARQGKNQSMKMLKVFLASPSDVTEEVTILLEAIEDWNHSEGSARSVWLQLTSWRHDTYPTMGHRPQSIINKQALDACDMLIGIFWSRFGSPTGKSGSGTEEEIRKAIKKKKPVMLYFSDCPLPISKIDSGQLQKIATFKAEFRNQGLFFNYDRLDVFKDSVRRHLAMMVRDYLKTPG